MKKSAWILGLILLIALFLRLFRLTELFHFTMDEELIAWRAFGLFKLHRPFLIGGISPLQVHLPPYFYYFSSLLLLPFKLDPVGWGWWAGLFSLVTVWLLSRYSRSLIAPLLYSVSLTAVLFDRHYWPLFFNPLFVLLVLWSLKQKRYLILMLTLVAAVTADPSNLTLLLFVLLYNFKSLKYWLVGLGIFFAPLLLFDLRHNWQNFSGVTRLFDRLGANPPNFGSLLLLPQSLARFWYTAQTNLIEIYSYCLPYAQARLAGVSIWLLLTAVIVIMLAVRQSREIRLLLLSYFIGLGIFGLLGFSLFDHYLTGLMPVWAMITALFIRRLPKKLGIVLVAGFVVINLYQFSRVTHPYGLKFKNDLVNWANQQLAGQPFSLESVSKCHRENGLRYLFELSGNPPVKSFMDGNFSWLYPSQPSQQTPATILFVTDKSDPPQFPILSFQNFGALKVYFLKSNPN